MNAKEGLKLVGGSIVVYVIMAACSAGSGSPGASLGRDGSASSSSGGAGSGGDGSSILDALTDPVGMATADPNQSGTRLKLTYYAGADGSKQAAGLHDSMLNVDCSFETMGDGTLRCAPVYAVSALISSYYADAACSQPLALTYAGCSVPAYAASAESSSCPWQQTHHVFAVSGPYSGASYYSGSPGSCSGPNPASAVSGSFYAPGAELPPSNFVQATIQQE
jgi:hypothetical protein